jgi:small-conductance mechanosensitive channel
MYRSNRLLAAITGFAVITLPCAAIAQAAAEPEVADAVTTLASMVRWTGLIASLVLIASAWLLLSFLAGLVGRLGATFTEYRLVLQKINAFTRFAVYLVTIVLTILLTFEISRDVLAILGGTAAVAIGFATKDLVSSLVAGMTIMFDRPFQVGDRVEFGGEYGDIVAIGLRSVKLRTLADSVVTIPNNMLLNQVTSCGNYGVLDMQVVMDFLIGVDQDASRARAIVREAGVTSRYVYFPKPVVVRVNQVIEGSYVALRIRLKAYVLDTQYEKAFETDVTLRVLDAFREASILPPAVLHRSIDELETPPLRAVGATG